MKKQVLSVDQILTKKAIWEVLESAREEAKEADGIMIILVKDNNINKLHSSLNKPNTVFCLDLVKTSLVMEELL